MNKVEQCIIIMNLVHKLVKDNDNDSIELLKILTKDDKSLSKSIEVISQIAKLLGYDRMSDMERKGEDLTDNYRKSLEAIYDHVGFNHKNTYEHPLDIFVDKFWNMEDESVYFADSKDDYDGNYCQEYILENSTYIGEKYTMILTDSQESGRRYNFCLFLNTNKLDYLPDGV